MWGNDVEIGVSVGGGNDVEFVEILLQISMRTPLVRNPPPAQAALLAERYAGLAQPLAPRHRKRRRRSDDIRIPDRMVSN